MAGLAAATTVVSLAGCASRSTAPGKAPAQTTMQGHIGGTGLAAALNLVPDIPDGYVFYTDWSAFGHRYRPGSSTANLSGFLARNDALIHRDLGIRSTDAVWELDVDQQGKPPLVVLRFGSRTDLTDLPGKLRRFGYHGHGPVLTGNPDQRRMWTFSLPSVGIDLRRHLLVGGRDVPAIRAVLAAPASPLGHAPAVIPLVALASARLRHIASASVLVGRTACLSVAEMLGLHATPAQIQVLRKRLRGTFTRPQAEITALRGPAGKIALDALTFPSARAAQANRAGRSAAQENFSGMGNPKVVRLTSSAVTGRVLSFDLSTQQPGAVSQEVLDRALGLDVCP
jgi:hypothetical protein